MCAVCDARKHLDRECDLITDQGNGDVADKFRSFGAMVSDSSSVTYSQDSGENKRLKIIMIDMAAFFLSGYRRMTPSEFALRLDKFALPADGSSKIRRGMRSAVEELYDFYGNRLPWSLYGGYMFMAARPALHVAERLPDLAHLLPQSLRWECIDAVWHGLPPATTLYLHILSVINRHTKTIPLHGCGCNHYLPPILVPGENEMVVKYPAPLPEDLRAETEVPVAHFLVQIELLVRGLPHSLGETQKARAHERVVSAPHRTSISA